MCCNMPLWYGWYLTFANDFLFSCYASVTNTSNHGKNLWNCRGAPDETTCSAGFFRCHSALALIFMKLFHVCANKFSLSLSLSRTGDGKRTGECEPLHYSIAVCNATLFLSHVVECDARNLCDVMRHTLGEREGSAGKTRCFHSPKYACINLADVSTVNLLVHGTC